MQDDDWDDSEGNDEEDEDAASDNSDSLVIYERYEKKLRNIFGTPLSASFGTLRFYLLSLLTAPAHAGSLWSV